ncbi:MAG: DUF4954 family protein [Muribaculaceae bacterium]|nr:DUF4954 family protein [Muribaculaceae bacterium]
MTQSQQPQNQNPPKEQIPQQANDPFFSYPYPPLTPEAIAILEGQGCTSDDWQKVRIHPDSDLKLLRDVEFLGEVSIGLLDSARHPGSGLRSVLLENCRVGHGPRLRHIPGGIHDIRIGDNVVIENCARITFDRHPACGIGMRVAVLDETGSREVTVYPGLTAQSAMLQARCRRSLADDLRAQAQEHIDSMHLRHGIGNGARVLDCGEIHNVNIDRAVSVHGARSLRNGSIINNATDPAGCIAEIGAGTDADGFIIEDAKVEAGAIIRNCYVGQGVRLEKGFTAHDSLFFANCTMENGEACAVFAGPYTVSVHKGTLLIGCQTSFMNAGSSTNQSNHMYKLGPVHWGVLERGVKTSSGSYLMLGANIGAFSLLMGHHKTHPDSKEFPFSYLFGDPQGATVVVPAVMLRSCGLLRDELKWPSRDRRKGMPKRDRVIFDVLNPVTVEAMIEALDTIRPMLSRHADDDRYHRYKGMKLSRASLDRAMKLYRLGVYKYLAKTLLPDGEPDEEWWFPAPPKDARQLEEDAAPWVDLAGQPMPRPILLSAAEAESVDERETIFDKAFRDYRELERRWIAARFPPSLRPDADEILRGAAEFDHLMELDRTTYRDSISAETAMLAL